MSRLLQNKNSATRFQIMVEIGAEGPNIQQRDIATKLNLTPQAISEYIQIMVSEGLILSSGRSRYQVSIRGVNWMLEMLRELRDYVSVVTNAITNITTCAAIADCDIKKGQSVGLRIKDGVLVATESVGEGAKGMALTSVNRGEDVDISNIEGLVDIIKGSVVILKIPSIEKGGSRNVDLNKLKRGIKGSLPLGAIGIEALAALRRIGIEPQYFYGVIEAAIEAVHCGLSFTVTCTDDAVPGLIKKLQEEKLSYDIIELKKK